MGWACGTYVGEEKCIQGLRGRGVGTSEGEGHFELLKTDKPRLRANQITRQPVSLSAQMSLYVTVTS